MLDFFLEMSSQYDDIYEENKLLHYQLDMAIAKQLELQLENSRLREEVELAARERSTKKKAEGE